MKALLKEQPLNDEVLLTLLPEVESLLMDDQSPTCPMIQRTVMPSHQITCCCSGQELVYLLGCLLREITIIAVDRDRSYTWQMCSGDGGLENISPHYERQKWGAVRRNFTINNIVLVLDDTVPRSSWPLGRVLEVYSNKKDGLVRSVKVKTKTSTLVRPIDKLVLLEST